MHIGQSILPQQHLLEHPEQQEAILQYIKDEEVREIVRSRLAEVRGKGGEDINLARWAILVREVEKVQIKGPTLLAHDYGMPCFDYRLPHFVVLSTLRLGIPANR